MNTNVPSWKKLIPLMPFSDYQNFMEKNSEIERLRRTWKELWKLIQGYDLMKDAVYELDDDVQYLSSEITTQISNLASQLNSELDEYYRNKIDKVPDATPGNVSIFDDNHGLMDSGFDIFDLINSGGGSGLPEIETTESLDDLLNYQEGIYVKLGDPWPLYVGDKAYSTRQIMQRKIGPYSENNTHTLQIGLFTIRQYIDPTSNDFKLFYRTLDWQNTSSEWFVLNEGGGDGGGDIDLSGYVKMGTNEKYLDHLMMLTGGNEIDDSGIAKSDVLLKPWNFNESSHTGNIPAFNYVGELYASELKASDVISYMEKNLPSIILYVSLDDLDTPGKYEIENTSGWSITVGAETVMMRTVEVISENDKIYQRGLCYADNHTFYASRAYYETDPENNPGVMAWTDWVKE